ncbi:hypothetical protein [Shewanella surugensis]|uniref:Uncharacterized protein n=1 Tax=Shewanella surugensis TaxID=212020 RepID=A0ABT0LA16_9GAMM|nr:hypothetical protein [Shewanella surugensis]MCL1124561.1 hypothetical protein [Shewanella surugensis]
MSLWSELYPEIEPYLRTYDHYHHEMLKLLVKRLILDVIFTGETLPTDTEPTDGWLPHIEHLKPK